MKLQKRQFPDCYALIGLGALLLQFSSGSMPAADPTLTLNFVRSADKTDGNFNRTQTNATTGTWFLSDSTAGAKASGSVSVSPGGFNVSTFTTFSRDGSQGGSLGTDASESQTMTIAVTNRANYSGVRLLTDYLWEGSYGGTNVSSASAYVRFINNSDGDFKEGGILFASPQPQALNSIVTFGTGEGQNNNGISTFFPGTRLQTTTIPDSGDGSVSRLQISVRPVSMRVVDQDGHNVGFSMTSPGGNAAAQIYASGTSIAGFTLTNSASPQNTSHSSTVTILQGTAGADRVVNATFTTPPSTALTAVTLGSDAVDVSGTADSGNAFGDKIVIQLSLDESAILTAGLTDASMAMKWFDPVGGTFKDAYLSDSDSGAGHNSFVGAYNPNTEFQLGNYGVDPVNHTVWAVVDSNSEFAAVATVPEPGTAALMLGGVFALVVRRRRKA